MASEASGKGAEESPGLLSGHQGRVGNHQDTEGGPHTEQTTKSALSSGYPPLTPCHWQLVLEKNVCWEIARNVKSSQIPTFSPSPRFPPLWWMLVEAAVLSWGRTLESQGASAEPKGLTPEVLMSLSRKEPRN